MLLELQTAERIFHKRPNKSATNDRTKSQQTTEKASKDLYDSIIISIFAAENKKNTIMNPTIDTYRLTSMEEPSDAVLSQLMKEAAEEAKRTNEEATTRFFEQMREDAQKISATW